MSSHPHLRYENFHFCWNSNFVVISRNFSQVSNDDLNNEVTNSEVEASNSRPESPEMLIKHPLQVSKLLRNFSKYIFQTINWNFSLEFVDIVVFQARQSRSKQKMGRLPESYYHFQYCWGLLGPVQPYRARI